MFAIFLSPITTLLPPCASEDASNCYWNASTQGNGIGVSYVNILGTTVYTSN